MGCAFGVPVRLDDRVSSRVRIAETSVVLDADGVMSASPATATAATMTAVTVGTARESPSTAPCVICFEADVDTALVPCGHYMLCARCAHNLVSREAPCPMCRAPVDSVLRVFAACRHDVVAIVQQQERGVQASMTMSPSADRTNETCKTALAMYTEPVPHYAAHVAGRLTDES